MSDPNPTGARFAVCIRNAVREDRDPPKGIDESGEDYLYPSEYFLAVELPDRVEAALLRAS